MQPACATTHDAAAIAASDRLRARRPRRSERCATAVTVQTISNTTSSSLGSRFNVGNTSQVGGHALASPGEFLVVQISVENNRGDAVTGGLSVSDTSGSGFFFGEAFLNWVADDTSLAWVEFSGFPLQADQMTPTGECDYSISLTNDIDSSGVVVEANVFTI